MYSRNSLEVNDVEVSASDDEMQWTLVAACLTSLRAINDFTHYTSSGKLCRVN